MRIFVYFDTSLMTRVSDNESSLIASQNDLEGGRTQSRPHKASRLMNSIFTSTFHDHFPDRPPRKQPNTKMYPRRLFQYQWYFKDKQARQDSLGDEFKSSSNRTLRGLCWVVAKCDVIMGEARSAAVKSVLSLKHTPSRSSQNIHAKGNEVL